MVKTTIVVYLGEKFFAAVEIKVNKTGAELLRYAMRQLPKSGFSGEWLKEIWKKEYFGHTKVIALLPQGLVKFKSLSLPNLPDEQIRAAVRLELDNSPPGEIYRIINLQRGEQQVTVKLAMVSDAALDAYLNQFERAGLTVKWAGLNFQGIQNYLAFNFDFFEGEGADVYLSIDGACSELGALTDTELLYRRALVIGGDHLTEDFPKYLPELVEEIRLSLASYQAVTNSRLPKQIWIFGEAKPEQEWLDRLGAALGIFFVVPDKTRLSGVITRRHTSELAPLIGLALDEAWLTREDWRFNTNEQTRRARNRQKILVAIKGAMAGAMLLMGLVLGVRARALRDRKNVAWLNEQKEAITELRRVEKDANQKVAELKTLEEWLNLRGQELEFLRALRKILPERTQITDLTIEDGLVKILSGSTTSVSTLLDKLQRTPELKTFKLRGAITVDKSGMELFQLEGRFAPEEKTP